MQNPETPLQLCQHYFPGLAWHTSDDHEKAFAHRELAGLRFDFSLIWNGESYAFRIRIENKILLASFTGSCRAALAQAVAHWREFAADAAGVVAAPPKYKPSPEVQRQSDVALIAYLLEGERRKGQGLPPDPQAQANAAAEAMAEIAGLTWVVDKPPHTWGFVRRPRHH